MMIAGKLLEIFVKQSVIKTLLWCSRIGYYCSADSYTCMEKKCDDYEDGTMSIISREYGQAKAVCKHDHYYIESTTEDIRNSTTVTCCLKQSSGEKVWMAKHGKTECIDYPL